MTSASFTNPITGTSYRLREGAGGSWRITKSITAADGATILRHLRLTAVPGTAPEPGDIDRLVRGDRRAADDAAACDPTIAFAETVLLDLHRTSTVATALAAEAREQCLAGIRGFRPGCATLRRREQETLDQATDACRRLAAAWQASGLRGTPGLVAEPDWLAAALADAGNGAS